jgi:hypothetical protein
MPSEKHSPSARAVGLLTGEAKGKRKDKRGDGNDRKMRKKT